MSKLYLYDAPPCATTTTTASSFTATCNLQCSVAYATVNGCPVCSCETTTPCTCPPPPSNDPSTKLCPDKVTSTAIIGCSRNAATNVCLPVRQLCPIGIVINMKTSATLPSDTIQIICYQYNITAADVNVVSTTSKNGNPSYTVWINPSALPAGFKFQGIVDTTNQANPGGVAYLMSSTTTTGSAVGLIVSLMSIVFVMLI